MGRISDSVNRQLQNEQIRWIGEFKRIEIFGQPDDNTLHQTPILMSIKSPSVDEIASGSITQSTMKYKVVYNLKELSKVVYNVAEPTSSQLQYVFDYYNIYNFSDDDSSSWDALGLNEDREVLTKSKKDNLVIEEGTFKKQA